MRSAHVYSSDLDWLRRCAPSTRLTLHGSEARYRGSATEIIRLVSDRHQEARRQMENRIFFVEGRHVSIALEEQFWDCLEDIAIERDISLRTLVRRVGQQHPFDVQSALRLHVLEDVLRKTGIELTTGLVTCDLDRKYH